MQKIDKVTVIGANGTMGQNIAAIFASFGNAEVYLVSRTKQKSILSKNKAYHSVRAESIVNKMIPVDFDELEECVNKSELIFEACKEDWDVKIDIHTKISDVLRKADKMMPENIFVLEHQDFLLQNLQSYILKKNVLIL